MAINAGTVYINVIANTAAFQAQMKGLGSSLVSAGAGFTRAGSLLTRGISVPLGLAGLAATKLALDYRSAFVKIAAVTDASNKQIGQWRDQVLNLAGKTAQAPEELANALYFLASAGLDAKEVFPALVQSAKASAIGLGDTADVAKVTAQALNAYSKEGLKAADVTDTLVAAVKFSTAEPDEFAKAMGRIFPIASKAGVGFRELAASLSIVSNIGLNVNEGVTAMRGLLQALVAPGTQAAETMHDIGLSTKEVRDSLNEVGILETVKQIEALAKAKFGEGWIDAVRKIIPNIRALTGAFALTAQEQDNVKRGFEGITHAVGEGDTAFERTTKGPQFKLEQQLTKLKVVGIEVGQKLIPILIKVADVVVDLVKGFSNLSPSLQENIVKWGLLAIALGPVVRILGGILTVGGLLIKMTSGIIGFANSLLRIGAAAAGIKATAAAGEQLTLFGGASAGAGLSAAGAGAVGVLALIAGAAIALKIAIDDNNEAMDREVELLRQGVTTGQAYMDKNHELTGLWNAQTLALEGSNTASRQANSYAASLAQRIEHNQEIVERFTDGVRHMSQSFGATTREAAVLASVFKTSQGTTEGYRHHIAALVGAYHLWGTSVENVTADHFKMEASLGHNAKALDLIRNKVSDEVFTLVKGKLAVGDYANAYRILTANYKDNTLQQVKNLLRVGDLQGAYRLLKKDLNEATQATRKQHNETAKSVVANRNLETAMKIAAGSGKSVKQALNDIETASKNAKGPLQDTSDKLKGIGKQHPKPKVDVDASGAQRTLQGIRGQLETLTGHPWVIPVQAKQIEGSPIPEKLIEILTKALEGLTTDPWVIKVKSESEGAFDLPVIKKTVAGMNKVLETLTSVSEKVSSTIKEAVGEKLPKAYADSARALKQMVDDKKRHFTRLINEATKAFDKIKAKADEFRDTIRSSFDQFDLLEGALGLGDVLTKQIISPQIEALKAQLEDLQNVEIVGTGGANGESRAAVEKRIKEEADAISEQIAELEKAIIIPTAEQLKDFFRQQVDSAGQFAIVLAELQKAGLDPKLLADIASQGISALPFAQQLLSDPTLLAAFETAQNAIDQFAKKTSDALTTANFGEKMRKLAGHVDDLNDKIREFNNRMERRMEELVEAIKSEKIANKLDQFVNALDNAIARIGSGNGPRNMASGGIVRRPTLIRAGEAGPEAIIPLNQLGSYGGGGGDVVVNLTVKGNAIYAQDLAEEVRSILLRDKRHKGALGLA